MKNGFQPTRLYSWLASWIRLGEEIACILTLAYVRPHWSIDFWAWYHRAKWTEIIKYRDGKKDA